MPAKRIPQEDTKVSKSSESEGSPNKSDALKLKRPPSGYIMFCNEKRNEVKAKNPELKAKEIMSHFGNL